MFVLREVKDAEVVVLDNLHALFPSSLQAGPESCGLLNQMVDSLHLAGKTVILVHHSSRGGASFGSSVKELGLELKLKITRNGNELTIMPEAARGLSPDQMVPRHFTIPSSGSCLEECLLAKPLPCADEKKGDLFDEAIMRDTIDKQSERDLRTFSIPLSSIKVNGKKINYFDFISSLENADCSKALKRILPKINMDAIFRIVDETPFISDLQKQFYKTMLQTRKERILDFAMEKLRKREKSKELEAR